MTDTRTRFAVRAAGRADAPAITKLIQSANVAAYGEPDFSQADLEAEWGWPRFDVERDAWVARSPDGTIVGYAHVWERAPGVDLDGNVVVHPDHAAHGLEEDLLARIEARAHAKVGETPASGRARFCVQVSHRNVAMQAVLSSAGFAPLRYYFRMSIDLETPPEERKWPPGVTVKACERGRDEPAFHAVVDRAFEGHFRHYSIPAATWIARHTGFEFYRPEHWFLAISEGRPIGAVVSFFYDDIGWVDELGVLEDWRGRGIGRALLLESFASFWRAGQKRVGLGVDAANATGATQLYESAGMRVSHRVDLYEKALQG
jgi:mycothiol synthase